MAIKLIIEPIFEGDSCVNSYGFRPKRSAHDAVDDIANTLWAGYTHVIVADLSNDFDSIPHAKLMAMVAQRIVDGASCISSSNSSKLRSLGKTTTERRRPWTAASQQQGYVARRRDFPAAGPLLPAYSGSDMATAVSQRNTTSSPGALRRRLCRVVLRRCLGTWYATSWKDWASV